MRLREYGFTTEVALSLLEGAQRALNLLDLGAAAPRPTLILLDNMLPHERCPPLYGTVLAAHLIELMEARKLRLAHIVIITADPQAQRRREAEIAGCSMFFGKPLTHDHARQLRTLVEQTPLLPADTDRLLSPTEAQERRFTRELLRYSAMQLMHFVRSDPAYRNDSTDIPLRIVWDEKYTKDLLIAPHKVLVAEPWSSWIYHHGGVDAIRTLIRQMPLPPDLAQLRDGILQHPDPNDCIAVLHLSRSSYYHKRAILIDLITRELNHAE
jgi:CheY-like chemotaxis protein